MHLRPGYLLDATFALVIEDCALQGDSKTEQCPNASQDASAPASVVRKSSKPLNDDRGCPGAYIAAAGADTAAAQRLRSDGGSEADAASRLQQHQASKPFFVVFSGDARAFFAKVGTADWGSSAC